MKTNLRAVALLSLALTVGCSSGSDSTKRAQDVNEAKIDKQAVAISSDAKDEAKKVTDSMVELASMSMTEYELSKLALQRAVNPQVKAYAQQTMNDHQRDERDLRTLAKQLNVVLPATLAEKGKDRVEDLADEKAGTAFDVAYLNEMAKVNDKAIDVADDLKDDAPTKEIKTFAQHVMTDDKKHKEQAKQLKNVLD